MPIRAPERSSSRVPDGSRAITQELDGSPLVITGYTPSHAKTVVVYVAYAVTLGILRLVFHWVPHWLVLCTHTVCPLSKASKVVAKDSAGVYYTLSVMSSVIDARRGLVLGPFYLRNMYSKDGPQDVSHELAQDRECITYFIYKRLKYILDKEQNQFTLLSESDDRPYAKLFPTHPLSEAVVTCRRALYDSNDIPILITPLPKLLLSICLNPFYCFQVFSVALWMAEDYWIYATFIAVMSSCSLLVQLWEIHRNELALKQTIHSSSEVTVCRQRNGATDFYQVDSTELVPGDLIEIPRKGCLMHCDAFVLTGNCIVNESTLTGESAPVTKTPLPERQQQNHFPGISSLARHVLFGGTSVVQTRNYANEPVLAMVVRTGFRTAKGELVRSILYPKPMKFRFTQDSLKFVGALAVMAAFGLFFSIYLMVRAEVEPKEIVLRALDLITIVIPPALPLVMTVGTVFAQRRLKADSIFCINPNAINVCGVINVTCFDKTGTLTEDGMDLWGVLPNNLGQFGEAHFTPSDLDRGPLLEALASCHSLTRIEGVLSGDPLDLKMFQSTKWEFIEEVSEDHCKFGMIVPAIVRPETNNPSFDIPVESPLASEDIPYEVGILRQFPFTSSLQRMSVIARVLNSTHFSVYTKGAPELIETLCRRDTIPCDYQSVLLYYAREGYRVLALAWRPLKVSYTRVLRIEREKVEQDLLFLGFLIMENRLKPESTPVIQTLRKANIRPVMVTGDNMLTAISVARDCEIIDEQDRIIIVSAKPPQIEIANSQDQFASARGDVRKINCNGGPIMSESVVLSKQLSHPSDDQPAPLVEFHYAEDLHKPVTEVTTTSCRTAAARNRFRRKSRSPLASTKVGSMLARVIHSRKRTPDRRVLHGSSSLRVSVLADEVITFDHNDCQPSYNPEIGVTEPSPVRRVHIRMIDRPDFHLAISGKTWAVIRDHYPWLIPKLVVKGTVFARFSPEQKTQLIEALQSVGYYVAMCGDGANDCGALKAAHAGVALSEAEASVASPFTSKRHNISCVPTLIREGRCALMTSFGTFKFMAAYSLVQFFTTILLYVIGANITDIQFLYIDMFLITTLGFTFAYTKSYPYLSVELPGVRLLSAVTMMSLGFQVFVNCAFQAFAYVWVQMQPWYIALFKVSSDYELENYESTVVFRISAYQYITLAIVFSKGPPYRKTILSNYLFIANAIGCIVLTACFTALPVTSFSRPLGMLPLPSSRFTLLIHGLVLANFLLCYVLELIVDGVSFRRRLLHIRRALFPRRVQRKDYERIREEIDKLAGSWPPIIRSASVQALPKELFHDNYNHPVSTVSARTRKRTISRLSTDSVEEDRISLSHPDISFPVVSMRDPVQFTIADFGPDDGHPHNKERMLSTGTRNFISRTPRRRHSLSVVEFDDTTSWGRRPLTNLDKDNAERRRYPADVAMQVLPSAKMFSTVDKRQRSISGGVIAPSAPTSARLDWHRPLDPMAPTDKC